MPARLEEAFGSGLNTAGHPNPNQMDDLMTSLNSLTSIKNPEFKKFIHGNGNNSNQIFYQQSGGGNNSGPRIGNNSGPGTGNNTGGWCPSVPSEPNRPSLVYPYSGDNMFSSQSSAVAGLACQALTCSPKPFDAHVGVPKAHNWDTAVSGQVQGTQSVPASRITVSNCSDHFQHIWACSDCRQKLKKLLFETEFESKLENKQIENSSPQVNLSQTYAGLDLPNLVYHLLLGLGLLILLDTCVRIGRRG